MQKNGVRFLLMALVLIYATACTKESSNNTNNGSGGANGNGTFVWTENDNTFAAANTIACDSAYASAQYKTIFVYKGATTARYFYEVNLSSLAVANYPVTVSSANAVSYIKPGSTALINGFAGSVDITANANNKITGTGVVSVTIAGTAGRLYIKFTDLPIR